jgi:hypothetical protein
VIHASADRGRIFGSTRRANTIVDNNLAGVDPLHRLFWRVPAVSEKRLTKWIPIPNFATGLRGACARSDLDRISCVRPTLNGLAKSRRWPFPAFACTAEPNTLAWLTRIQLVCHNERLSGCQNGENTTG